MKVLIAGGCGFIGSNAARYFSWRGDAVIAVDNLSRRGAVEHARYVEQLPGARLIVAPRHTAIPEVVGSGNGILYDPHARFERWSYPHPADHSDRRQ